MSESNSFKRFLELSGRDEAVAREVFDRFAGRLVALARSRLSRQIQQKEDAEDVVQSVYRSFCARHAAGEFTFAGWDNLWSLLVTITLRKCSRRAEFWHAQQRDPRRETSPPSDEDDGGDAR